MSEINNIPKHWELKKLGDICQFIGGGTPSKKESSFWNGDIPWASIKDIKGPVLHSTIDFITENGVKNSATNIANPNELILATRINPGRPIISKIKTAINQDLKIVRPRTNINIPFLYYSFLNLERKIIKLSSGTTVLGINLNILNDVDIPFPPLPEQQAIVSKIEELFSELDNGIVQLKIAQQQLKVYRQSLLKWAYEGKKQTTVGALFDFVGGGTPSKKVPEYWTGEIPWASVKDIKGDYLNDTQDRISKEGLNDSASNLAKPKDVILITRISPGKTIISNIETAINQDLKVVKPKFKTLPKYIFYIFKSIEWDCVKKSSGTTVLGINLTNLKEISIPDLDLKEQQLIVDELESKLTICDKTEETISQSLQQAETLRQSILKKAFEGQLV